MKWGGMEVHTCLTSLGFGILTTRIPEVLPSSRHLGRFLDLRPGDKPCSDLRSALASSIIS